MTASLKEAVNGACNRRKAWRRLEALVNGDFLRPRRHGLGALLPSGSRFIREATALLAHTGNALRCPRDLGDWAGGKIQKITLSASEDVTPAVGRMRRWMDTQLADEIACCILHGSLGSGEVVPYSDFDALVVIHDEVFADPIRLGSVAWKLFLARRFMYEQDPLQHHGWFALPEAAFDAWPEDYLPVEVIRHGRLLAGDGPRTLTLRPAGNAARLHAVFDRIAQSTLADIASDRWRRNLHAFKSLLSKIMLMPALYVGGRDGRGVFKRDSFALARSDFPEETWGIMRKVSAIREDWPTVRLPRPRRLTVMPGPLGEVLRRRLSPPIPPALAARFGATECHETERLVNIMRARISMSRKDGG